MTSSRWQGVLVQIQIAPRKGAGVVTLDVADVVTGGITGDRFESGAGRKPGKAAVAEKAVTLIEAEAFAFIEAEFGAKLRHEDTRRNLLTRGVPLNDLIGRRFQIGDVILEGVELSDPCRYLEGMTGQPMRRYLDRRGGLRARVVRPGKIRPGDPIVPTDG